MAVPVDAGRWVRTFQPRTDTGPRLVCFPHAGGAASFYAPFAQALSNVAKVGAVQYPGRQERWSEPAQTAIGPLADRLAAVLADGPGDRPTAFFGHSMGAIVAFEVTRRLATAGGAAPVALFVSSRRAPSAAPSTPPSVAVHRRGDEALIADIARLGGTDPRLLADPEMRELILPPTRADYQAIETYACPPGATVDTSVTALVGDADPGVTPAEATAWREHTTGRFDLRVFPGGHFYLTDRWAEVAHAVRAGLEAAAGTTAP